MRIRALALETTVEVSANGSSLEYRQYILKVIFSHLPYDSEIFFAYFKS